jgi:predicted RecB family endonuclease
LTTGQLAGNIIIEGTEDMITGRVLNPTEQALADFLGSERQAIALAPHVVLDLSDIREEDIVQEVIKALVNGLETALGTKGIAVYCGGERRDTLREKR